MDILNDRLKRLREERHLFQKDVADMLHVTQSTYSNYERGIIPNPDTLRQLANFYNVSISYLFGETNERTLQYSAFDALLNQLDKFQVGNACGIPAQLVEEFLRALIVYHTAGKPVGDLPISIACATIDGSTKLLNAANVRSLAQIIDAANTLAAAGLQANDVIKEYYARNAPADD